MLLSTNFRGYSEAALVTEPAPPKKPEEMSREELIARVEELEMWADIGRYDT